MVKNPPASAGDAGSIPGPGRSPGGRHGNPLHYACLENSMDGGAQQTTVHGIAELDRTERLTLSLFFPFYFKPCKLKGPVCRSLQNQSVFSTGRQLILFPGWCSSNIKGPPITWRSCSDADSGVQHDRLRFFFPIQIIWVNISLKLHWFCVEIP